MKLPQVVFYSQIGSFFYTTLLHLPPCRSHLCAQGCWCWTQDCCRVYNWRTELLYCSISHPHQIISHPHFAASHPQLAASHPHLAASHPHLAASHPHLTASYPHLAAFHPHSACISSILGLHLIHTWLPITSTAWLFSSRWLIAESQICTSTVLLHIQYLADQCSMCFVQYLWSKCIHV